MQRLNLDAPKKTQLPASAFPTRADVYVCDKCGRKITKHFRPGQAHVWKPMGAERYRCRCGQLYLTGATEWDHLGNWERKRRVNQTSGLTLLFSVALSVPGFLVYLAFHRSRGALIAGLVTTALPFVLVVPFWLEVVASMWRTRIGSVSSGST